jgi:hypothetical protein
LPRLACDYMTGFVLPQEAKMLDTERVWMTIGNLLAIPSCVVRALHNVHWPLSELLNVLPRRWVVKRTLVWMVKCRHFEHDYQRLPRTSGAMVK